MTDWLLSLFQEFRQNVRVADAVDILLIAVLLYLALVWFKAAASRQIAAGASVIVAVYFFARAFDLYLTSLVLQASVAVVLIVLVVVFQEDLRRIFERLAHWGSFQEWRRTAVKAEVDALVEAMFYLAHNKTGALVVLQGNEPLDRHLDGGIELDGRLSKPLLYSIFDSSSPGHDGAAVVDEDRVVAFAARLPLSKNQKEIRGKGTRHSAALGLAECSDALMIVVSEESGVVSIAEEKKLREVPTAATLKTRVESFYETHFPVTTTTSAAGRFVKQDWRLKALSLAMSIVAWFLLAYNTSTIQRTFVAPIVYRNVPKQLVLDEWAPIESRVTLSGSERSFAFVDPASLTVTADLANAQPGMNFIAITERNVRVPAQLEIYRLEPNVLQINLRSAPGSPANGAGPSP